MARYSVAMPRLIPSLALRFGHTCRSVAVTLLSGLWPGLGFDEIEARLRARPAADQAAIVGAVLAALFVLSLLFAQLGWIGLCLFWIAVIVVAR